MDYCKREVERNFKELKRRKEWRDNYFTNDEIKTDQINKVLVRAGVICLVVFVIGFIALLTL